LVEDDEHWPVTLVFRLDGRAHLGQLSLESYDLEQIEKITALVVTIKTPLRADAGIAVDRRSDVPRVNRELEGRRLLEVIASEAVNRKHPRPARRGALLVLTVPDVRARAGFEFCCFLDR